MSGTLVRLLAATLVAVVAAAVGACSNGNNAETSEVLARVDEIEITASQLRAALLAKGETQPTAQEAQQALDALVNEQLLVDAALANHLDRDPEVQDALEAARRQVLARAYVDRAVLSNREISAAEQTAYFRENPELFTQRRIYQIAAFTVASEELTAGVVKKLNPARSADGVALVLTGQHIAFEWQNLSRAAEQLPLEQLRQFAAGNVGDVLIQPVDDERSTLMLITGMQHAPLGFESAQPFIEQYLANARNAEALATHLKSARAAARIIEPDASLLVAPAVAASDSPTRTR
jgi:EpsD family peptidyl-prolyl cis-trans isomerase